MDIKGNRNAIIIGIISGLLVIYFIDPILSFLGNIVIKIAGRVYKSYLDNICSYIAMGEPNFSFTLYGLLTGAIFGMTVNLFAASISVRYGIPKEKQLNSISYVYIYIFLIIAALISTFMAVDGHIRFNSYVNFKQGMAIVSPYVSDIKNKEILSKFSLMENTEDYNKIIDEIKSIAASNRIKLPKNVTTKL